MKKILVAYASRMGSTAEIAERIGAQLRLAGHEVDVQPCATAEAPDGYDAVIIGSALYVGRWEKAAVRYFKTFLDDLVHRPTWLFQSGPCGEGAESQQVSTPRAVRRLVARTALTEPVTFGGRLDRSLATSRVARWMATGTFAGDFRDWVRISAWTSAIAAHLAEDVRDTETVPAP